MALQIGKRIRERRTALGYTQKQLGDKLGVYPMTVSCWERGTKNPDLYRIESVAKALQCTVADLVS
jgi:transcriptional regulator with XRE-family HTH domain